MSPLISVNNSPEDRFLIRSDDALFSRIETAAEWCQQTEHEFIKAGILDRLDDVEALMAGWDFEDCSIENPAFDVKVAIVPTDEKGGD